jgi:cell division protein FtsN
MRTIASLTTPPTIRVATPAPVQRVAPPTPQALASVPGPGKIGCFESAPVPKVYATSNGGRVVLCTRGDGTLEGARAPIYAVVAQGVGNRVGAGIYEPGQGQRVVARVTAPAGASYAAAAPVRRVAALPPVPRGYKPAWTDDRLNPNRGIGTAEGQAQQDQVWTREVPARLVAGQPTKRVWWAASAQNAPQPQPVRVQASTMTEPRAQVAAPASAAAGRFYVQVGTFAVPANADGAEARLRNTGLRVGTAKITQGGKPMQIVLAGPFGDTGSAQAALAAARGAGFGDAFIR